MILNYKKRNEVFLGIGRANLNNKKSQFWLFFINGYSSSEKPKFWYNADFDDGWLILKQSKFSTTYVKFR